MTTNTLCRPDEVSRLITAGKHLVLAGDESLLRELPAGSWIGGTIPYFMSQLGGCVNREQIFVTELPPYVIDVRCRAYDSARLPSIYEVGGEDEVAIAILPSESRIHGDFALNAPRYPGFATYPLIGWIAGVHLSEIGRASAKVFCGSGNPHSDVAAVIRFRLPRTLYAEINTINLFRPGSGDSILFPTEGFSASTVLINGKVRSLADYLLENKIDTRLPLVADYCGTMVNVSFREVDAKQGKVAFYAPVWPGLEYKLAAPIGDYVSLFNSALEKASPDKLLFSCNCILNYLYSQLEGRKTAVEGPITFGEIAYQLLNQTFTYLSISSYR